MRRSILAVVAIAVTAAAAWTLVGPGGALSRSGAGFDGPLPTCHRADELTPHRTPDDWRLTLLDPAFTLTPSDAPPDLVDVSDAGVPGRGKVRRLVIDDLRAMDRAARKAGLKLTIRSAYRSSMPSRWRRSRASSVPTGPTTRSRPRLGRVTRSTSSGRRSTSTAATQWLATHAWRYGFVVSYPPEWSPSVTCYKPEPWHLRYVGREAAAAVHDSGLSLREWLWDQQD